MKYRYLIVLLPAFVVVLWGVVGGPDDVAVNNEFLTSYLDNDQAGDIGETLNLLVSQQPIPRIPLKDLFADPASKKLEAERIAAKRVQLTAPVEPAKSRKITTTPRLIGILIRSSEAKAFFVDNDKAYSLRKGDKLAGRYRITAIRSDRVNITELSTGLSRTIYAKEE